MTAKLIAPNGTIAIDCEPGQVSDGYHTFDELYEHRCLLWIALLNQLTCGAVEGLSFKTRRNKEGKEWPGWFIAGLDVDGIGQISYHLPDKYWDLLNVNERHHNRSYDGHTSQDVIERLKMLATYDGIL